MNNSNTYLDGERPLMQTWKGKALLSLGVFGLCGFAGEFALRMFAPVDYRKPNEDKRDENWKDLLHAPSDILGLGYELVPNRELTMWKTRIQTNELGMRDDSPLPNPPETMQRIVSLGDSVTFGFGVAGDECYPTVLERILNGAESIPGCEFEVLNMGVSGYSTRDESLVFEHKALGLHPDFVTLGYHLNDPEDEAIQPLQLHFSGARWWQHSHLLRGIAEILHDRAVARLGDGDYFKYLHAPTGRKWQVVVESLEKIQRLAGDVPVLVLIFPFFDGYEDWDDYPYLAQHAQVAETVQKMGFEVLDVYEVFQASGKSRLDLRRDRGHPNAEGHRLVAVELRQRLAEHYPCVLKWR